MGKINKIYAAKWLPALHRLLQSSVIREGVIYLLAFSAFTFILFNRSPNILRPLSMNIRFGFTWLIPALFIMLYLLSRMRGWLGKLSILTATLSLFAFALSGMWASGHTQSTVLSGLIPMYDAQTYHVDALRLLAGRSVSEFSAGRPLFTGLLAVILAVTGRSLMMTLIILTAINGLACYFAAQEIKRTHGELTAVFLFTLLFLYYRYRTIGTVMSENLGFPLGILGVALIWRGITNHAYRLVLYGLFLNTLGLNARPGAFFMLPALLIWGSLYFRTAGRHFSWRFFLLGVSAMGVGFALNLLMVRLVGTSSGVPISQFSYALYGTASGGNSWSYVFEAHPELAGLPEPEMTQTIYKLIFELIRTHPYLFLQGALHNWSKLFSNTWYGVFSFVGGENLLVNMLTRFGLYLLCLLGLAKRIRNADPHAGFIIAATLGILISVPFVPPSDAYGMRLYAASSIVIALLPALGLAFLLEYLKINDLNRLSDNGVDSKLMIWYSGALVFFLMIGPLMVRGTSNLSLSRGISCQPGKTVVLIQFDPGSFISIIRQNDFRLDWLPVFHKSLFKRNAHALPDPYLAEWLETIDPPATLFSTLDYHSNKSALVVISTSLLPKHAAKMQLCGEWTKDPSLMPYDIFVSEDAMVISD
jgi:hypothetical protein